MTKQKCIFHNNNTCNCKNGMVFCKHCEKRVMGLIWQKYYFLYYEEICLVCWSHKLVDIQKFLVRKKYGILDER